MFLGHIPARIGQKHIYTTNTKFDRVCDILQKWQQKFELNNVSEPLSSIQHIVAFNLGIKNVSTFQNYIVTYTFIRIITFTCLLRV